MKWQKPQAPTHGGNRKLPLPLLVARIDADDVHAALASDYFAVFADSFDTGADFHRSLLAKLRLIESPTV